MTKLGPHILNPTDAAKHWAANAPIVKQAFGIEALRIARLRAPTICRPIWMLNKSGEQAAREILTRYLDWKFIPTYTELWNEYDEWGRDELRERLRQCKIAGDILRQHGCKVGDNIASTGTLEEWEWRIAAEENFGGMDFLPVHEYWGCLSSTMRVLTADLRWVEVGSLKAGDLLLAPEEEPQTRARRALLPSRVISNAARKEEVYDIVLATGERLRCTGEHPWLVRSSAHKSATKTKHKWATTYQISQMLADKRRWKRPFTMPRYFPVWVEDTSYQAGYLAGVFDGEGSIATKARHGNLSFAQKENELLFTAQTYLTQLGFDTTPLKGKNVEQVYVNGGRAGLFRFLGSIRPPRLLGIWRKKIATWQQQSVLALEEVPILSVEKVGLDWICSLETSTHTYFAEGFGSHNSQGFTTWHALRYRRMHNILNGKHPPIIVTETGRDKVEGGNGGWKTDGVSQEQYIAEIKAYDAEIQKDNYVLGATPFTSGPGDNWANFDMDGLEQYLIEKEKPMPVEYRDRWLAEYSQWKAGGGVSDVDFLAWMAATKGLQLTAQEYDLIANATKGNIEALKQLAQHPKA